MHTRTQCSTPTNGNAHHQPASLRTQPTPTPSPALAHQVVVAPLARRPLRLGLVHQLALCLDLLPHFEHLQLSLRRLRRGGRVHRWQRAHAWGGAGGGFGEGGRPPPREVGIVTV
eukprot:2522491-Prymnesium_polylepis.3